jgi:hypothetical protein
MMANPLLGAVALLIKKYGKKIEGGGYEVEVSNLERISMSPHGILNEVPSLDTATTKWQYFPNTTIEGELVTPESVTPTSELPDDSERRSLQHPETDDQTPA